MPAERPDQAEFVERRRPQAVDDPAQVVDGPDLLAALGRPAASAGGGRPETLRAASALKPAPVRTGPRPSWRSRCSRRRSSSLAATSRSREVCSSCGRRCGVQGRGERGCQQVEDGEVGRAQPPIAAADADEQVADPSPRKASGDGGPSPAAVPLAAQFADRGCATPRTAGAARPGCRPATPPRSSTGEAVTDLRHGPDRVAPGAVEEPVDRRWSRTRAGLKASAMSRVASSGAPAPRRTAIEEGDQAGVRDDPGGEHASSTARETTSRMSNSW